jgi:hypothetical protein
VAPPTSAAASEAEEAFALVPLTPASEATADTASTEQLQDSRALDVYSRVLDASSASTHQQHVHDAQQRRVMPTPNARGAIDLSLLRALAAQGTLNHSLSSGGADAILCPQAVRLSAEAWNGLLLNSSTSSTAASASSTPDIDEDEQQVAADNSNDDKQVTLFGAPRARSKKRARSVQHRLRTRMPALPLPAPKGAALPALVPSSLADEFAMPMLDSLSQPAPLRVGDRLLLWLPLQAAAGSAYSAGSNESDASRSSQQQPAKGMVEIACQIAQVRPVLLS